MLLSTFFFFGKLYVGPSDENRTRTIINHYPLKIACLPIPPHLVIKHILNKHKNIPFFNICFIFYNFNNVFLICTNMF